MSTRTYPVSGMTCGHCVSAVRSEVSQVTGVQEVSVDLEQGTITVTGDQVDDQAVAAAVDEAGYAVVG